MNNENHDDFDFGADFDFSPPPSLAEVPSFAPLDEPLPVDKREDLGDEALEGSGVPGASAQPDAGARDIDQMMTQLKKVQKCFTKIEKVDADLEAIRLEREVIQKETTEAMNLGVAAFNQAGRNFSRICNRYDKALDKRSELAKAGMEALQSARGMFESVEARLKELDD